MTATTTAPVFTPDARFLSLFTFAGRHRPVGKMHLARLKSTKKPVALAWCGRHYFVDPHAPKAVTGEAAFLYQFAEEQPTCALCLARVGAWEWEW